METSILSHFGIIKDPRINRRKLHRLVDILAITIVGGVCGAEGFEDIETIAHAKEEWLRKFLQLPHGIPSHDTINRVISRIKPEQLQACFTSWVKAIFEASDGEVIAIDGKTARRSFDKGNAVGEGHGAIHMVSAWASKAGICLGQVKTNEKSNEITAIPELLRVLDIKGCIVTIDAMGCQKKIAKQIIEQKGDYVLALKDNQANLAQCVETSFEQAAARDNIGLEYSRVQDVDKGHGRIETRIVETLGELSWLDDSQSWPGLESICKVTSIRESNKGTSTETRYFISSVHGEGAGQKIAEAVRRHWGIENSLHWVLDVSFNEDQSRIRRGSGAENFATLRRISLNLLKGQRAADHKIASKRGIKARKKLCGWDNRYLSQVLAG